MSKNIVDTIMDDILNQIFDANWIGRRGEKLTERELKLVKLLGRKGKILKNIYIPKDNGETTEIDVVYITQKGIFVIESKNYSGCIFGDEKSAYWTAMLPNKQKNRFYNPIIQNQSHLKWLGQYLENNVPLFSIVTFSERCELKKVAIENSDIYVIKRERLYATIREIWENTPDKLDDVAVETVYNKLQILSNVDATVKQTHIDTIKGKYSPKNQEDKFICPKCGGKLILRTAKKGTNIGKQFYGCSNFPNCRFIQNIDS